MIKHDSNLNCPVCQNQLSPTVLACGHCHIKVEGDFQFNEFARMSQEDLHFLRIFIRCEGRIRDMEPALGLSYPTIRNRLSQLKNALAPSKESTLQNETVEKNESTKSDLSEQVLEKLEKGEIKFEEAMKLIKKGAKK